MNDHQLKLMDSKCKLAPKPEEHMFAASCLIFFGPQTRTPTLDSLRSKRISASEPTLIYQNMHVDYVEQNQWEPTVSFAER